MYSEAETLLCVFLTAFLTRNCADGRIVESSMVFVGTNVGVERIEPEVSRNRLVAVLNVSVEGGDADVFRKRVVFGCWWFLFCTREDRLWAY